MIPGVRILDGTRLGAGNPDGLAQAVSGCLGLRVLRAAERLDLDRAWDPSRRQYNATALMAQVARRAGETGEKCVALVEVDLFVPVLTFVFGQAALAGDSGIVSIHRLANPFYGLPRNDALLRARVEKEVLHEFGHMLGLYHCHHFECVMRSSTYVEEIDLKRAWFCPDCEAKLPPGRGTSAPGTRPTATPGEP